jgi:hypothetical protein
MMAPSSSRMEVIVQTFLGRCHCGNVEVALETARAAGDLPLRACGCSFCRKHGVRTTADPKGRARIVVQDPSRLIRYRFEQATADFLVCGGCGVYMAAVLSDPGAAFAVLNVNAFDERDRFVGDGQPVHYDGESADGRRARRRQQWTPVEVVDAGSLEPRISGRA